MYNSIRQRKQQQDTAATAQAGMKGQAMPSVSILQKATPEELQKKAMPVQMASPEELQKKAMPVQMATPEELQKKAAPVQMASPEELQKKAMPVQMATPEELQKKAMPVQMATPEELQKKEAPVQKKANNTGMPDQLKSGVESLSGMDLSDVKVHYNSSQPAQLNALAYAQGNNIHIGPGQEQHLPHEAWHVVQQRQGRVKATAQMKQGVPVNDDPGLEHEADVMGAKAASMPIQAYGLTPSATGTVNESSPFQFILTRKESVAADLMYDYDNGRTLFRDASWNPFIDFCDYVDRQNARNGTAFNRGIFMAGVRNRINDGRIPVDYEQLSTETLQAGQNLITWLSSAHHEHMWINDGGTMRVARRNAEKKPHPTLAGGDPNVSGAGLFTINTATHRVTINNQSGHFRPDSVDQASRTAVNTALTGTGYTLVG